MINSTLKNLTSFAVLALFGAGCACEPPPPPPLGPNIEVIRELKLTEVARIPQNDPSFSSVDIFENRLVFHYSRAPTATLEVGNVIAGNTERGYLRRLTAVTAIDEKTLEVTTEPAELVDFILDGAFRVKHRPPVEEWPRAPSMGAARPSAVVAGRPAAAGAARWVAAPEEAEEPAVVVATCGAPPWIQPSMTPGPCCGRWRWSRSSPGAACRSIC